MKRLIIALCIIASLLTFPQPAYAADALYRMLHADQVEQFKEDQDALLVGQIIVSEGDKFKVKVLKLLSGKASSDIILVSSDFTYGWEKTPPKVNDYAVFSLKKTGNYYRKAWGIYKATSGDFNTLKLEVLNAPTPGLLGDLACIQWYVNSGGKESDFHGHNEFRYVRNPNGQEVQIYPVQSTNGEVVAPQKAISTPPANELTLASGKWNGMPYVLLVIVIVLLSGIGVFIRRRN